MTSECLPGTSQRGIGLGTEQLELSPPHALPRGGLRSDLFDCRTHSQLIAFRCTRCPSSDLGVVADVSDHLEHAVDVIRLEEGIRSRRAQVGERRLVEPSGFDDAMLGEVVDDQVHELDLVGGVPHVVEEDGEGLLGGSTVEPDETTG